MRDSDLDRPEQGLPSEVLKRALHTFASPVVLTDPTQFDDPIVWVNDAFETLTGYRRDEVIGRNCRFMQGDDHAQPGLDVLRRALDDGREARVLLRNYRKDGTLFWNDLRVTPVPADEGGTVYYAGLMSDVTELQEAQEAVRTSATERDEAAENERERFGMDLHDGLGQTLTGLRMLAAVHVARLEADGHPGAQQAARMARLLDQAMTEMRGMARGFNPVDPGPDGLADAIQGFVDALNLTLADVVAPEGGAATHIETALAPVALGDRRQALHLFRIAQEAVQNALKHAGAATVSITLDATDGRVTLEVRDDGRGLAAAEAAVPGPARRGMGHHGMRYRAGLLGAHFHTGPAEGGGTVVRVVLG
jgi:two-component system, LuxR family, sensor kinase FixL